MTGAPQIRAETRDDVAGIAAVASAAFGRPDEAELVAALRADPAAWLPQLSLVAADGDAVVGHVLLSRAVLDGPRGGPAAALAPVAVLPARQGRGIGTRLVRAVLAAAAEAGERLVVVVGHAAWYPRFGFTSARAQGVEAPFPVDDDVWLALDLQRDDPAAVPAPQGRVVYPPAFHRLP